MVSPREPSNGHRYKGTRSKPEARNVYLSFYFYFLPFTEKSRVLTCLTDYHYRLYCSQEMKEQSWLGKEKCLGKERRGSLGEEVPAQAAFQNTAMHQTEIDYREWMKSTPLCQDMRGQGVNLAKRTKLRSQAQNCV